MALARPSWGIFAAVPVVLLAEIPFMMAKFAVFDAFSKLAYSVFPQATESVTASLAVSLISGMIGETKVSLAGTLFRAGGGGYQVLRFNVCSTCVEAHWFRLYLSLIHI